MSRCVVAVLVYTKLPPTNGWLPGLSSEEELANEISASFLALSSGNDQDVNYAVQFLFC